MRSTYTALLSILPGAHTRAASLVLVAVGVGSLAGSACSTTEVTPQPQVDAGPKPDVDTGPKCDATVANKATFEDRTKAWGLENIVGSHIESGDLDGDGYPDLLIGGLGANQRGDVDTATRRLFVLMNRPDGNGGRTFVDTTIESGLYKTRDNSATQLRATTMTILADVDNDGDLDVFSGVNIDSTRPETDPKDRNELLLNDGTGHFTYAPDSEVHNGLTDLWPTTAATFTDADRDGKIDLFVGFWYKGYGVTQYGVQAQLYNGKGDGTFKSVTNDVGLKTSTTGLAKGLNHRPAYGVSSCDLNDDGAPELLISAYGRQWNMLYQNDGSGSFTDVGQQSGFGADGNLDYKDNDFFRCYCTAHAAEEYCAGVSKPKSGCPNPADSYWNKGSDDQPWRLGGNTFTTYCSDIDGDGKLDLINGEIKHWHIGQSSDGTELIRNVTQPGGEILFDRPGNEATGMNIPHDSTDWNEGAITLAGGDLDNDGREDIVIAASDYPGNYSWVFHQKSDGTFEEVGKDWNFHHACASGISVADFDRDGDLDVIVGTSLARDCAKVWTKNEIHLYENKSTGGSKFLLMKLVGDGAKTNKGAVGARVTVKAGGKTFVKELQGGYGVGGIQNDTILHFGLGACDTVDEISVRFPNKDMKPQVWKNVQTSRFIELRENDPEVHLATLKK